VSRYSQILTHSDSFSWFDAGNAVWAAGPLTLQNSPFPADLWQCPHSFHCNNIGQDFTTDMWILETIHIVKH
jgi:hypothetical protein